jgi:hypothetical protein
MDTGGLSILACAQTTSIHGIIRTEAVSLPTIAAGSGLAVPSSQLIDSREHHKGQSVLTRSTA